MWRVSHYAYYKFKPTQSERKFHFQLFRWCQLLNSSFFVTLKLFVHFSLMSPIAFHLNKTQYEYTLHSLHELYIPLNPPYNNSNTHSNYIHIATVYFSNHCNLLCVYIRKKEKKVLLNWILNNIFKAIQFCCFSKSCFILWAL